MMTFALVWNECRNNKCRLQLSTCMTITWKRRRRTVAIHIKNGFVTATKLETTNEFFVASTKNFAAATKRFVDRTKPFVVVTKYFCYPNFYKWLCWYNKILNIIESA